MNATPFAQALAAYEAEHHWLLSQISDDPYEPLKGDISRAERLAIYGDRYERMADFLAFCDHPERRFKSVHVAGTSGKGSVTVMIAALLSAAGLRTGDHVSPYLQVCNEKLRIDGRMIAPTAFAAQVAALRRHYESWVAATAGRLRYGQLWVALTYFYFAQEQVDWAVVETGLGGRLNVTNLLPADLAVVTNIEADHLRSLGPSLPEIAWHKVGIIRPGRPAVTAERKPEMLALIVEEAARQGAPLAVARYYETADGLTVPTPWRTFSGLRLGMGGRFQAANAALALTAVTALATRHPIPLSDHQARQALAEVVYNGRYEIIQNDPLVILDGAHNPHKMAALMESVRAAYPQHELHAVVGLLRSKDATATLSPLLDEAASIFVSAPDVAGKPPVQPAALAAQLAKAKPDLPITVCHSVREAVERALTRATGASLVLVTGSLYLVGAARDVWRPRDEILRALEAR